MRRSTPDIGSDRLGSHASFFYRAWQPQRGLDLRLDGHRFRHLHAFASHDDVGWGSSTGQVWLNSGGPAFGVPTGYLSLHPGSGTEPAVLRWTAPADYGGLTQVNGQFLSGDGGTMQVAVRHNHAVLWNAADAGTFSLNVNVAAGDTLDFAVFGGYYYGNTPLQLAIVGVPEPSTLVLLALGLALPASRRWRRRHCRR